jgi:hypothetical protein
MWPSKTVDGKTISKRGSHKHLHCTTTRLNDDCRTGSVQQGPAARISAAGGMADGEGPRKLSRRARTILLVHSTSSKIKTFFTEWPNYTPVDWFFRRQHFLLIWQGRNCILLINNYDLITHTHWHIIFWVVFLSWIVFPPWPKIIGEKRTCTGLVGGGKNIFPFLTSFQKRLGVPIVVSNPNQKREKEPYYILLLRILHRPLDGSPVGKCLSTIFLLYYFALFCVYVCVYFQGGKCESKWNKRIVVSP